jgi:hypothetical protein
MSPRLSARASGVAFILGLPGMLALPSRASGHGAHAVGKSSSVSHLGARIATIDSDESLKLSIDFEGYFSGSVSSGWGTGEPLGAGGKMPLYYSQFLHLEAPYDRPDLARRDYWPQYRDFSYVPLWQPSQFGVRVQYALVHTVRATVAVEYFGGSMDAGKVAPNPLEFEEYSVRWTPEKVAGLSLAIGHLLLVGSYAQPFDQFPLEFYQLNGVELGYDHPAGAGEWHLAGAAGRMPIGRSSRVEIFDTIDPNINLPVLDTARERTNLYGRTGLTLPSGLYFGLLAGYQVLPAGSSTTNVNVGFTGFAYTTSWPRSSGWQIGGEAGFVRPTFDHHLVVSHGEGDVEMGWGAPDPVYRLTDPAQRGHLLREGSSLSQAIYWGGLSRGRFRLSGGIWGQWRRPARAETVWKVVSRVTDATMDVRASTQHFRAVKANVEPSIGVGPLAFGVRLDGIRYLDKNATTNTVEPLTDEALRPIPVRDPAGMPVDVLSGPSYWEREAADCAIVSPFVAVVVGDIFHVRASWSGAWYSRPVHRQNEDAAFHANITLTAWLVYRFGVGEGG